MSPKLNKARIKQALASRRHLIDRDCVQISMTIISDGLGRGLMQWYNNSHQLQIKEYEKTPTFYSPILPVL